MRRTDYCKGWTYRVWGAPGDTPVDLPHDYSQHLPRSEGSKSGSAGGWFQGANIIYDKELDVTEDMLSRRVLLEFEGVFPNAEVYLDDVLVARQPYGYLSFYADLTPHLRPGKQKIRVNVHGDALPNSRWYVGTGICRPVWLAQAPKACILPEGLHVVTEYAPEAGWQARVTVRLSPEACQGEKSVRVRVQSPEGAAAGEMEAPAGGDEMSFRVPCPLARPWTPETPVLYRAVAELWEGDFLLDSAETRLGFREIRLDEEKGLLLSERPVKLRGGCVHHDHGVLGAVSLSDAEYRKAKLLKDFGYNAVRCAHNPPAPAFLDACDELGLLVMDEFTDMWNIGKNPYDYHLHFRDRWREDLKRLILRDRNHPSIIMWSVGNEIPERDGSGNGYALCREMCALVRQWDASRPITAALNNIGKRRLDMLDANVQRDDPDNVDYFGLLSEKFLAPLDVAGYNYLTRRYEQDLAAYPHRFICGTESVAGEALECWKKTMEHPRVIGDFAWAAMDYLGEAGIGHVWYRPEDGEGYFERWPWRQANCGDLDLCGAVNPAGRYRRAVWGEEDAPFIAVQHPARYGNDGSVSYWAWPERFAAWDYPGYEGKPVRVEVYSASSGIRLRLNGRSVGAAACEGCKAVFDLPYEPGTLEAVDEEGRRGVLSTPGKTARIETAAEVYGHTAWIRFRLTDENGVPCRFDERRISLRAEGCALLACGNACPASAEGFQAGSARAWRGEMWAAVSLETGGKIIACAEGLPEASLSLP